jgi:hypothetical protein
MYGLSWIFGEKVNNTASDEKCPKYHRRVASRAVNITSTGLYSVESGRKPVKMVRHFDF